MRLDPFKARLGDIYLGDSISKVLTYLQNNFQIYGRIEFLASKTDIKQPLFLALPDSGKRSIIISIGLKMKFEAMF